MHELAITESLVDLVVERTAGNVRVGDRSGVVPDAMSFCFDVVAAETPLAGAALVIEECPGEDLALVSVELVREPSCA